LTTPALRAWLLRCIGLLILVFLLTRMDLGRILHNFTRMALPLFMAAFLADLAMVCLKAARWRHILRVYGRDDPWPRVFMTNLAGYFLGLPTPGQAGEFAKIALLPGASPRLLPSAAADRLMDVGPSLLIGLVGGILYLGFSPWLVAGVVAAALAALGWLIRYVGQPAGPARVPPASAWGRLLERGREACRPLLALRVPPLLGFLAAVQALFFLYVVLLARALHLDTGILHLVFFVSLFALSRLLPISLMGVGTRDALSVLLFRTVGVAQEDALAFSLAFLLVDLCYLFGGFLAYLRLTGRRSA